MQEESAAESTEDDSNGKDCSNAAAMDSTPSTENKDAPLWSPPPRVPSLTTITIDALIRGGPQKQCHNIQASFNYCEKVLRVKQHLENTATGLLTITPPQSHVHIHRILLSAPPARSLEITSPEPPSLETESGTTTKPPCLPRFSLRKIFQTDSNELIAAIFRPVFAKQMPTENYVSVYQALKQERTRRIQYNNHFRRHLQMEPIFLFGQLQWQTMFAQAKKNGVQLSANKLEYMLARAIKCNLVGLGYYLITQLKVDIHQLLRHEQSTPLQLAYARGQVKFVRMLLAHGAITTIEHALSVLGVNIKILNEADRNNKNEIARLIFVAAYPLLEAHAKESETTPLHLVCRHAQAVFVAHAVAKNPAAAKLTDDKGKTTLHLLAFNDYITDPEQAVDALVTAGADVNAQDFLDTTALHRACLQRGTTLILALLRHGANPHLTDHTDKTALDVFLIWPAPNDYHIKFSDYYPVIVAMMARGLLPPDNIIYNHIGCLLCEACRQNNTAVAQTLLEKLDNSTEDNRSRKITSIFRLIFIRMPGADAFNTTYLYVIAELLQRGADFNCNIIRHRTSLYMAVEKSLTELITLLLKHGADPLYSADRLILDHPMNLAFRQGDHEVVAQFKRWIIAAPNRDRIVTLAYLHAVYYDNQALRDELWHNGYFHKRPSHDQLVAFVEQAHQNDTISDRHKAICLKQLKAFFKQQPEQSNTAPSEFFATPSSNGGQPDDKKADSAPKKESG